MAKKLSYNEIEKMEEKIPKDVSTLFLKSLLLEHIKIDMESTDYSITEEQLNNMIENLMDNDGLWEDIEYHISNEILL